MRWFRWWIILGILVSSPTTLETIAPKILPKTHHFVVENRKNWLVAQSWKCWMNKIRSRKCRLGWHWASREIGDFLRSRQRGHRKIIGLRAFPRLRWRVQRKEAFGAENFWTRVVAAPHPDICKQEAMRWTRAIKSRFQQSQGNAQRDNNWF